MCSASASVRCGRRGCSRRPRPRQRAATAHGISSFGDLKYPPDFHHFDYVNLDAPKGGSSRCIPWSAPTTSPIFTFNSLNAFILKGEGAQGMDLTFATLMARANDEPDAVYGYAAKSVQISPDKLTYRFTLRPEARFHDGSKMTAPDVAFSLNTLKEKGHPLVIQQLRDMVKAEAPRRCNRRRDLRAEARARRAALCRGPADLLAGLLRQPYVRGIHARYAAGLGALQGRQIRGQPLHRIRSRQGLVGGRSAGQSRQLQFRYRPL